MKYQCAYTTEAGVTVTLTVSASPAWSESVFGAEVSHSEAAGLAASAFCRAMPALSALLPSLVPEVELALQSSCVAILKKSLDEQKNTLPLDTPRDTSGEQCRECTGDGAFHTNKKTEAEA